MDVTRRLEVRRAASTTLRRVLASVRSYGTGPRLRAYSANVGSLTVRFPPVMSTTTNMPRRGLLCGERPVEDEVRCWLPPGSAARDPAGRWIHQVPGEDRVFRGEVAGLPGPREVDHGKRSGKVQGPYPVLRVGEMGCPPEGI